MLADAFMILVVLAVVAYVWIVQPVKWFRSHKGRRLPDVW